MRWCIVVSDKFICLLSLQCIKKLSKGRRRSKIGSGSWILAKPQIKVCVRFRKLRCEKIWLNGISQELSGCFESWVLFLSWHQQCTYNTEKRFNREAMSPPASEPPYFYWVSPESKPSLLSVGFTITWILALITRTGQHKRTHTPPSLSLLPTHFSASLPGALKQTTDLG